MKIFFVLDIPCRKHRKNISVTPVFRKNHVSFIVLTIHEQILGWWMQEEESRDLVLGQFVCWCISAVSLSLARIVSCIYGERRRKKCASFNLKTEFILFGGFKRLHQSPFHDGTAVKSPR